MTVEPTIWFQLGISDERYRVISMEISSIIRSKEKTGIMMEMVRDSCTMNRDEKLYAAFMVSKADIENKLISALPTFGKEIVKHILEE